MDEDTARWVRVEAAKAGKSVSRWLGELVETRRSGGVSQAEAFAAFIATGPYDIGFDGAGMSREEMNERESLRRFQRSDLHEGSSEPVKEGGR
jgi:deoxyribose-phosphate aldolase